MSKKANLDKDSGESSWKKPDPMVKKHRVGTAQGWNGVPIRYTEYGAGEPAIVCCNGVGVSTFFWKYVVRYFAPTNRVITWDYRGHGGSGLPDDMSADQFTMTANARDLAAVLNDCDVSRAVLLGHSMGCQVLLEFWCGFRRRVAGLIPICGAYGRPIDTFFGVGQIAHPIFNTLYTTTLTFPRTIESVVRPVLRSRLPYEIARLGIINAQLADFEDMRPYFEHLSEMDLRVFFLMAGEMQRHDASPWLRRIDVPMLVVAGEKDLFTPLSLSHQMREEVPNAEILVLPRGSHAGLIEHPELLNLRIEKFLRERVAPFLASRAASASRKRGQAPRRSEKRG